jgi:hypothetical protein
MQSKVLSLLHELVPKAVRVGVLVNPTTGAGTEATSRAVREAAPALGLQIQVVNGSTIGEINAAFAALARERADALFAARPPALSRVGAPPDGRASGALLRFRAGECQSWRRMTRRSLLAIGPCLLVALRGRLKPCTETGVDLAPGRLDRGELRMAEGRGFLGRVNAQLQWQSRIAHHREHKHRAACRPIP